MLFLVGAGFAMNQGMVESGLAAEIVDKFEKMKHWPIEATIAVIVVTAGILSQIFVSIAAVKTIMSFLLPLSTKFHVHPLRMCFPAALVASGAYLLPVSGASLALVTARGNIAPTKVLLIGLPPWIFAMIVTYIHSFWYRVVFHDYDLYPKGIRTILDAKNCTD